MREQKVVLVTGGAGYIGSTVCSALEDNGHVPVVIDSLITGRAEFARNRRFYDADIGDTAALKRVFAENPKITCVVHCAALIDVPESTEKPLEYYEENVSKTLVLLKYLREIDCHRIVLSSSSAVYADEPSFMVTETSAIAPDSPYAWSKWMQELLLRDFCRAYGIALF
jgi:UDP-glucose 4-epimerase